MGGSKQVAEWFIQLDEEGKIFIDTPLYAYTSALHSHKDMLKGKKHMCGAKNIEELSYEAECSIGQGESASSMQWTVLYDMVLEWIDLKNRHLHVNENLRVYSDETARDAAPFTYADDLATVSGGPFAEFLRQLQEKWFSAFCAFSGLMIHPGKIQTTIVGKVHDMHQPRTTPDGTRYCPSTLTVFDHQWEPIICPIDPTVRTRMHLDLSCKNTDAFDRQKERAAAMLSHLLIQEGSPEVKINYIRFKIMPIILYTAQVSN
jgi:hypothetical protein